jgi:hypothetical protein
MSSNDQTTSPSTELSSSDALPAVDALPPSPPWTAAPETSADAPQRATDAADPVALPSPPRTGTERLATDGDLSDGAAKGETTVVGPSSASASSADVAGRLARRMQQPIPRRWLKLALVALLMSALVFAAGWLVGARDPRLAPVRLASAPVQAGMTLAERVYPTVNLRWLPSQCQAA